MFPQAPAAAEMAGTGFIFRARWWLYCLMRRMPMSTLAVAGVAA